MGTGFTLPDDAVELLLFLERFRVAVLRWADVLEITSKEREGLWEDYTLLRRALVQAGALPGAPENDQRVGYRLSLTAVHDTVRWRLGNFILRLQTSTDYSAFIGYDLRIARTFSPWHLTYSPGNVLLSLPLSAN